MDANTNIEKQIELKRALISSVKETMLQNLVETPELYKEIFRLWNISDEVRDIKEHSDLIREIVLEYICKNISAEELTKRINELVTLMSISETKEQFVNFYEKKYHITVNIIKEENIPKKHKSQFTLNIEKALNFNPKEHNV